MTIIPRSVESTSLSRVAKSRVLTHDRFLDHLKKACAQTGLEDSCAERIAYYFCIASRASKKIRPMYISSRALTHLRDAEVAKEFMSAKRLLTDINYAEVARKFGISARTVKRIVSANLREIRTSARQVQAEKVG